MTELTTTRTLEVVAAEIRTFTASMLNNIIEIGRRMCEAKEMLPYGQFGAWVQENTGYSKSTANNFMRIFEEYGAAQGSLFGEVEDVQTFGKLSYSKALALLQVPSEERQKFVTENDVDAMSVRELQDAIRERDEAKKALSAEQNARILVADQVYQLKDEVAAAQSRAAAASAEAGKLRAELEELRSRPVDVAVQEPDPALLDQIRAEEAEKAAAAAAELEKKLAAAEAKAAKEAEKAKKLKEKVDKAGEEAKAAMQKDIEAAEEARKAAEADKADAVARAEAAENKLKTANGDAAAFKVYFNTVQEDLNRMLEMIQKMEPAQKAGCTEALRALLSTVAKTI